MTIAVDFDGTIVEHAYPAIGKELPFATATLRQLIRDGHQLILWSVREGKLLEEAVKWCEERGVHFYAVNQDLGEDDLNMQDKRFYSRKLKVQMFIDDRNLGGLPDWGTIYRMIKEHKTYPEILQERHGIIHEDDRPKKKHWWQF